MIRTLATEVFGIHTNDPGYCSYTSGGLFTRALPFSMQREHIQTNPSVLRKTQRQSLDTKQKETELLLLQMHSCVNVLHTPNAPRNPSKEQRLCTLKTDFRSYKC